MAAPPIVKAFVAGEEHAPEWLDASTSAAGIRVPKAIGDFLILRAVRASGAAALAVSEAEIEAARALCGRADGLLLCPEGAATLAAARKCPRRRADRSGCALCAVQLRLGPEIRPARPRA